MDRRRKTGNNQAVLSLWPCCRPTALVAPLPTRRTKGRRSTSRRGCRPTRLLRPSLKLQPRISSAEGPTSKPCMPWAAVMRPVQEPTDRQLEPGLPGMAAGRDRSERGHLMFPLLRPIAIGAIGGALANRRNPLQGALLGGAVGATGGLLSPAAGAAGAAAEATAGPTAEI